MIESESRCSAIAKATRRWLDQDAGEIDWTVIHWARINRAVINWTVRGWTEFDACNSVAQRMGVAETSEGELLAC